MQWLYKARPSKDLSLVQVVMTSLTAIMYLGTFLFYNTTYILHLQMLNPELRKGQASKDTSITQVVRDELKKHS